jgi:hypothetical protein
MALNVLEQKHSGKPCITVKAGDASKKLIFTGH